MGINIVFYIIHVIYNPSSLGMYNANSSNKTININVRSNGK